MRHPWQFIFPLFAIICLTANSCKKEEVYPVVTILSPPGGGYFSYGDTISVRAKVSDPVDKVRFDILKGDRAISMNGRLYDVYEGEYTYWFFFDDKYLESGNYEIRVSAESGGNRGSDFSPLYLQGLPLQYRGLTYISAANDLFTLNRIDSIGHTIQTVLAGDQIFLANNSRYGQVIVAPGNTGQLSAFEFKDLRPLYTAAGPGTSLPGLYTNLYVFDQRSYALVSDGRVLSFNREGNISNNFSVQDPYIPFLAEYGEQRILLAVREGTQDKYDLLWVRPDNGFIEKQVFVPRKPVGIAYAGKSRFFIAYSKNDAAVIAMYNIQTNLLTELYEIPEEVPQDIIITGEKGYLGTSSHVYTFHASEFGFPELVFSFGTDHFAHDRVNHELYMASGSVIYKVKPGSQTNVYVAASEGSITDISVMYNK